MYILSLVPGNKYQSDGGGDMGLVHKQGAIYRIMIEPLMKEA